MMPMSMLDVHLLVLDVHLLVMDVLMMTMSMLELVLDVHLFLPFFVPYHLATQEIYHSPQQIRGE